MPRLWTPAKFALTVILSASLGGLCLTHDMGWSKSAVKPLPTAKPAVTSPAKSDKKEAAKAAQDPPINKALYATVESLSVVKAPKDFLGKKIQFAGTFSGFSGLGLDYPKAMRAGKDYVNLLVRRPDVTAANIPMGELKLFYPRKKSEAVKDLNVGDQVLVYGQVFSSALNEPWVDVDQLDITAHTGKPEHPDE